MPKWIIRMWWVLVIIGQRIVLYRTHLALSRDDNPKHLFQHLLQRHPGVDQHRHEVVAKKILPGQVSVAQALSKYITKNTHSVVNQLSSQMQYNLYLSDNRLHLWRKEWAADHDLSANFDSTVAMNNFMSKPPVNHNISIQVRQRRLLTTTTCENRIRPEDPSVGRVLSSCLTPATVSLGWCDQKNSQKCMDAPLCQCNPSYAPPNTLVGNLWNSSEPPVKL